MNHINCNCPECLWKRILENSNSIIIKTIRGKELKYKIQGNLIVWEPLETTQNNLYPQSKVQIIECLNSRKSNEKPSNYPGTAPSYKWALLNHNKIWIS